VVAVSGQHPRGFFHRAAELGARGGSPGTGVDAAPESDVAPRIRPGQAADGIARSPVHRIGMPEEIAAACDFLISEEAGRIIGQIPPSRAGGKARTASRVARRLFSENAWGNSDTPLS
jgi:NAD(P)-dependent dehydrogenase (short-subunit alcohol dehydrogenase family)